MKILLILSHSLTKNNLFNKIIYTSFYPSITLEQLFSITPAEYEVKCVDERYEKVNYNSDASLIGISTLTINAKHAYTVADELRKRGKTVVLGGYHPSSLPDEAKQHADSVIIGEAERSWPMLLKDFEKGELKPFYRNIYVNPKTIPSPKRMPQYFPFFGMVQATRGCPTGCNFCSIQNVEGSNLRARSIDNVISEIKSLKAKRFFFADSSLTINSNYTKQLFKKMIGLDKKFSCYGNINVLHKDDELLNLAIDAGCESWLIGFESIDQKTIGFIGKKTNKVEKYASGVKKIKDYGMMVSGLFMFGFDTDKPSIFDTTLNAIYKMDLDRAAFAIVTPFPGTALFDKLDAEGRILTRDWSKYNLKNVVFKPKNMTEDELVNGRNKLSREFYSLSNCLRRTFRDKDLNLIRFMKRTTGDYLLNRFF